VKLVKLCKQSKSHYALSLSRIATIHLIDCKGKIFGLDSFGILDDISGALNVPVGLIEMSQIIDGGQAQRENFETGILIYEMEGKGHT